LVVEKVRRAGVYRAAPPGCHCRRDSLLALPQALLFNSIHFVLSVFALLSLMLDVSLVCASFPFRLIAHIHSQID
jgi:hypothetical protein